MTRRDSTRHRTEQFARQTGNKVMHMDEDADGNWNTGCQEIHVFISGTPHENGYVFCPYCGGKIERKDEQ